MNNREQKLDDFFDHYTNVFNNAINGDTPDLEQTAALFSNCFIAAHSSGVRCGENDQMFRDAMQKGYVFYKNIGITSMEVVSKTITLFDDFHAMVKVRWRSNFLKNNGPKGSIEFENIYFVQTKDSQHKVFAYITGDEQKALKENGLIE